MNTEKAKNDLNFEIQDPCARNSIGVWFFCVHLCSSVFPVFLLPRALTYRLEQADRAGGGGVEGLGAARHRNVRAHLRGAGDLLREAGPFVADQERARLDQVE